MRRSVVGFVLPARRRIGYKASGPAAPCPPLMPTSCSHYFMETIRGAERAGVAPDRLLANVGLTREQVFDPQWRGDVVLLARLVQLVWYALDDEFMGFVARPAKPGTFAMMTHCALQSKSLADAIQKGVRFYDLVTDGLRMDLSIEGNDAKLSVDFKDPACDPDHYFHEFWLTIWLRFIAWLGGATPPLRRATFAYPRPDKYVEEFRHMFRCPYEFEAPTNALVFEAAFLSRPVVRNREELKRLLAAAPLGFMMNPSDDASVARRIRTILMADRKLPLEFPTVDEIAGRLNMTEQTLRRRLKKESISYRAIKETIRRDVAVQKLIENRSSVQDIAYQLGYSESRAFSRAFQQWTGESPVQYRSRLRAQFGRPAAPGA